MFVELVEIGPPELARGVSALLVPSCHGTHEPHVIGDLRQERVEVPVLLQPLRGISKLLCSADCLALPGLGRPSPQQCRGPVDLQGSGQSCGSSGPSSQRRAVRRRPDLPASPRGRSNPAPGPPARRAGRDQHPVLHARAHRRRAAPSLRRVMTPGRCAAGRAGPLGPAWAVDGSWAAPGSASAAPAAVVGRFGSLCSRVGSGRGGR